MDIPLIAFAILRFQRARIIARKLIDR